MVQVKFWKNYSSLLAVEVENSISTTIFSMYKIYAKFSASIGVPVDLMMIIHSMQVILSML